MITQNAEIPRIMSTRKALYGMPANVSCVTFQTASISTAQSARMEYLLLQCREDKAFAARPNLDRPHIAVAHH
jgi:hypothetical protein